MGVKERLLEFIESLNMSSYKFEQECNIGRGYVRSISQGIGPKKLQDIIAKYPQLNREWLLYGEGEMLRTQKKEESGVYVDPSMVVVKIPIIPLNASVNDFNDFNHTDRTENCEMIISPLKNADFAIRVNGNSMEPEFPNGSIVLIKKIDENRFIDFSRVYVLNTINGIVIKRLVPGTTDDNLTCVSVNKEYPNFLINKSDISGVYVVCMVLIMK